MYSTCCLYFFILPIPLSLWPGFAPTISSNLPSSWLTMTSLLPNQMDTFLFCSCICWFPRSTDPVDCHTTFLNICSRFRGYHFLFVCHLFAIYVSSFSTIQPLNVGEFWAFYLIFLCSFSWSYPIPWLWFHLDANNVNINIIILDIFLELKIPTTYLIFPLRNFTMCLLVHLVPHLPNLLPHPYLSSKWYHLSLVALVRNFMYLGSFFLSLSISNSSDVLVIFISKAHLKPHLLNSQSPCLIQPIPYTEKRLILNKNQIMPQPT